MAVETTDEKFQDDVIHSQVPVLVDFYATWCSPCKILTPVVEEISKEYVGKLKVVKADIDKCMDTASRYGIMSVPTLIFFSNGEEKSRTIGAMPKHILLKELEKLGIK